VNVLPGFLRGGERQRAERVDGYLPLEDYAALGDGRTVALSGADGSIDWWCVPNMDSPPLFDRLLAPDRGGCFVIQPEEPFTVEQRYRKASNVHETVFTTASGKAVLVESLNSGPAGRLPWEELARRVEGLEGEVRFRFDVRFGTAADTVSPYMTHSANGKLFHAGTVLGLLLTSDEVVREVEEDERIAGSFTVRAEETRVLAIVAGRNEPLVKPTVKEVSDRIDISDREWREWAGAVKYDGPHHPHVCRSSLILKLLLYAPTGAIAAAATSSLPEGIGGEKNWDYRYAWIRDAGYTIKAFLRIGAAAEAKAALTWLIQRLGAEGPEVCYTLEGAKVPDETAVDIPGYRGSQPVRIGNAAARQHQHGIYGDIFETVARFVAAGNILDGQSAMVLAQLADQCADMWRQKDHGIWELREKQHYTMSKISCWQALARAVELAEGRHIADTCRERWQRERDRIAEWVLDECWSEERQAFLMWPGSARLDASLALAVRFGFDGREKLEKTLAAIDRELGAGPLYYRYSGVEREEGCFLACTFWIAEAKALLGHREEAEAMFRTALDFIDRSSGVYAEMADPSTGAFLGNLPQGLTHLALIQAAATLNGDNY
jgi:GH15 family glucan-1,4-alpha-glucosidase